MPDPTKKPLGGEEDTKDVSKVYSPTIEEGTNIRVLQKFLNESYPELGKLGEAIAEDGKWGENTHNLYQKFKSDNPKSDGENRRNIREGAPVTGFLEAAFPGAMTTISAITDDIFRKQFMDYGSNDKNPIRTEGDFTEDQVGVLRDITRKNLAAGKSYIDYKDYETVRPSKAYSSNSGVKTAVSLLTDPAFQTQSVLGRASIVTTPQTFTSEPDTLVLDNYDFNNDAYTHLNRNGTSTDKIKESVGKASSPYGFVRNVAQLFGSQEGDTSAKKYAVKTSFEDGGLRSDPTDPTKPLNNGNTGINNLGVLPDNYLNNIINEDLLIQENNRLASNYAKANPNSVVQQPINNDKIDFPNTDNRSANYVGNPNWAFAAPNMTGKQRADAEAYHRDIIGGELLGLGVMKGIEKLPQIKNTVQQAGKYLTEETPLKNTYKYNPLAFKPDSESYYRMLGNTGYKDAAESGVLRAAPKGTSNNWMMDNTDNANKVWFNKGIPMNERIDKSLYMGYKGPDFVEYKGSLLESPSKKRIYGYSESPIPIDNNSKFYTEDWLQGYKQIEKPNFHNGGIHNINRANISETFDEMMLKPYLNK